MYDEPLSHLSQTADHELEQRLVRALETAPIPQIPADFASRIAAQLPASRPVSLPSTHYGLYAAVAGMVVIFIAMLAMAGKTVDHSIVILILQWTLCAQFIAITVWLSIRRHDLS